MLSFIVASMMVVVTLCLCTTEEESAGPGPSIDENVPRPVVDIAHLTSRVSDPLPAAAVGHRRPLRLLSSQGLRVESIG